MIPRICPLHAWVLYLSRPFGTPPVNTRRTPPSGTPLPPTQRNLRIKTASYPFSCGGQNTEAVEDCKGTSMMRGRTGREQTKQNQKRHTQNEKINPETTERKERETHTHARASKPHVRAYMHPPLRAHTTTNQQLYKINEEAVTTGPFMLTSQHSK